MANSRYIDKTSSPRPAQDRLDRNVGVDIDEENIWQDRSIFEEAEEDEKDEPLACLEICETEVFIISKLSDIKRGSLFDFQWRQ